jgi:hypothetical protein
MADEMCNVADLVGRPTDNEERRNRCQRLDHIGPRSFENVAPEIFSATFRYDFIERENLSVS